MPDFDRDGLRFHYRDQGQGLPFFFQHGLGGDTNQPFGLFAPPGGVRLLGLDARGHGETRPLGDLKAIALGAFADDLVALMDRLGLEGAVVGGISMGAAIALNVALRYPDRVLGLVLSRPAWLDRPLPENTRIFPHIARYLHRYGARDGLARFRRTPEFRALLRESPDCAQAVVHQFESPRAVECVARLERIPHDRPCRDRAEWRLIRVPSLVLGNRQDPIHPWEFAEVLARTIPRAELRELTPKSVSLDQHAADVQQALQQFLHRHFLREEFIYRLIK
jgi:pimeloyl-ACP methyl ester carboxylesterase